MQLFKLEKNTVQVNPAILTISQFKTLWERDKSKDKKQALLELSFVYFLGDYKSVYLSVPPEERQQTIIEDLEFPKNWTPDDVVKSCVQKYDELQVTPSMRFLESQLLALEQSIEYFRSVDYKERDSKGKPVYSISEVTKSMKDSAGVLDSLEKIQARVKKELEAKGKIRGDNQELGDFEE